MEAVRQGAKSVVGVDIRPKFVDAARKRCPEAKFITGSWWDILLRSSTSYSSFPRCTMSQSQSSFWVGYFSILHQRVFWCSECGTVKVEGVRAWRAAKRADGIRRYPTQALLLTDLLSGYAVRAIGPSVKQSGDPVARSVYHCRPRANMAFLVSGAPGSWKDRPQSRASRTRNSCLFNRPFAVSTDLGSVLCVLYICTDANCGLL